jgi:hypothetical protein
MKDFHRLRRFLSSPARSVLENQGLNERREMETNRWAKDRRGTPEQEGKWRSNQ